jgi:exosortase
MRGAHDRSPRALTLAVWAGVAAALAWLYGFHGNGQEAARGGGSAIAWMVRQWQMPGGQMSHGWLVPLLSGFVVWRRRQALAAAPREAAGRGLVLLGACSLAYWVGVRAEHPQVVLFSGIGFAWGIPLVLCGWPWARLLLFPAAYLVFCIPLPTLQDLTVPLRLLASAASAGLLNGLGIPAVRRGTVIQSGAGEGFALEVADPCSGLHSLLAMAALTAAYAHFTQRTLGRQALLFAACLPVAVVSNTVRIVSIALVARSFGEARATGFYHDYSTYLVFGVAVLLVTALGQLLARLWPPRAEQSCPPATPASS